MRSLVLVTALVLACASSPASAHLCSFPRTSTGDIDREAIEQDAREARQRYLDRIAEKLAAGDVVLEGVFTERLSVEPKKCDPDYRTLFTWIADVLGIRTRSFECDFGVLTATMRFTGRQLNGIEEIPVEEAVVFRGCEGLDCSLMSASPETYVVRATRDGDGYLTVAGWSGIYVCTGFPGRGKLTPSEMDYLQSRLLKRRGKVDWSPAEGSDYVCVTSRIGATTCYNDTPAP